MQNRNKQKIRKSHQKVLTLSINVKMICNIKVGQFRKKRLEIVGLVFISLKITKCLTPNYIVSEIT